MDIVYICVFITCNTCYCLCDTYVMWNHGMYVRVHVPMCVYDFPSRPEQRIIYNAYWLNRLLSV